MLENAMAFQSVPNCASASIIQAVTDGDIVNVINFRHDGSYDQNDIDALAAAVDAWWSTEVLPLFDQNITYTETIVRGLTSENDLTATNNTGTGGGTVVGQLMPNNVAYVVTHRTGYTGRSARGRTYHGGLSNTNFSGTNQVTLTFKADLEAAWAELPTYLAGTGWTHVVISRFTGGAKRAIGVTFEVTSSLARNRITDSQRRRLPEGH